MHTCENFFYQGIGILYTGNVKFNKNNMRFGNWQIVFIHPGHFLPYVSPVSTFGKTPPNHIYLGSPKVRLTRSSLGSKKYF